MTEIFNGKINGYGLSLSRNGSDLLMTVDLDNSEEMEFIPPIIYKFKKNQDGWELWIDMSDYLFDDDLDWHFVDKTKQQSNNFPPTKPESWENGKLNEHILDDLSKIILELS